MRRLRRNRAKNQKQLLIVGTLSLFFALTVGYAAFSTTVSLTAKGNVFPTLTVEELKEKVVTTGDGLYEDPDEPGRYVYKGANPSNYLTLNNETWRIMSIESDNTLKIIREDSIGEVPFDLANNSEISGITTSGSDVGTRYSTTSTDFCVGDIYDGSNLGCSVWGSKDTMRNSEGVLLKNTAGGAKMQRDIDDATTYDLPNDEAYINVYLNGGTYAGVSVAGWYNTWSSTLTDTIKGYIDDDHLWNVGLQTYVDGQLTATDISQEKAFTWQGRVGLMTASEYVRASINSACTGRYGYNRLECYYNNGVSHNYLSVSDAYIITSKFASSPCDVSYVQMFDSLSSYRGQIMATHGTLGQKSVRPVLYLSSDVLLRGDGTTGSKFQIET